LSAKHDVEAKMTDEAKFKTWTSGIDASTVNLWREAMAQLRQLHGDVWNGGRFFLTVNGIVIAATFGIAKIQDKDALTGVMIASLAVVGLIVMFIARSILAKHRDYYLAMLLRKTLIEREFGFYDQDLAGIHMSFPWNVDKQFLDCLASNPSQWLSEQKRRRGTITRLLFLVYEGVIGIHVLILLAAVLGL
jgi:hypothetical protein